MTNALLAIDHEANRNHYPTLEETDLSDPIAHCELIDAAHRYARAPRSYELRNPVPLPRPLVCEHRPSLADGSEVVGRPPVIVRAP